jgi:glycosyltransferase involved in cell wall biosynthesis
LRIGIFVTMVGRRAAGPETYEVNLVRSLAAMDRKNEYHVFCLSRMAADSFELHQDNVKYHVLRPSIRWISIPVSLPVELWANQVDIFHATFIPPPVAPIGYVLTLHDLTTFQNPEYYHPLIRWRLNRAISRGLKKARKIVCVSACVRDMVSEAFQVSSDRLAVVHHGVSEEFRPIPLHQARDTLQREYKVSGRYLLFVGQMKARKNIIRILQAFSQFRNKTKSDVGLVLVGRRGHTSEGIDETIARLGLQSSVVELGHVKVEHLPSLYSAAEMLVFPSLFEGFGFPVIEAMACNTAVITSNVSAMPEVAGGCAMLVDPLSVEDIAGAIHRLYSDHQLRQTLQAKGLVRAKHFSWARAAQETMAAYCGASIA